MHSIARQKLSGNFGCMGRTNLLCDLGEMWHVARYWRFHHVCNTWRLSINLRGVSLVRGVFFPSLIDLTCRPYNTGHTTVWLVISALAVDGWAVTFGTPRRDQAGAELPRRVRAEPGRQTIFVNCRLKIAPIVAMVTKDTTTWSIAKKRNTLSCRPTSITTQPTIYCAMGPI